MPDGDHFLHNLAALVKRMPVRYERDSRLALRLQTSICDPHTA